MEREREKKVDASVWFSYFSNVCCKLDAVLGSCSTMMRKETERESKRMRMRMRTRDRV